MFSSLFRSIVFLAAIAIAAHILDQPADLDIEADMNGRFFIPISVNEQHVRLLVDTGASHISMDQELALELGLLGKLNAARTIQFKSGPFTGEALSLIAPEISVGGQKMRNVEVLVIPGRMDHAVIGRNLMRRFESLRFEGKRLIVNI